MRGILPNLPHLLKPSSEPGSSVPYLFWTLGEDAPQWSILWWNKIPWHHFQDRWALWLYMVSSTNPPQTQVLGIGIFANREFNAPQQSLNWNLTAAYSSFKVHFRQTNNVSIIKLIQAPQLKLNGTELTLERPGFFCDVKGRGGGGGWIPPQI